MSDEGPATGGSHEEPRTAGSDGEPATAGSHEEPRTAGSDGEPATAGSHEEPRTAGSDGEPATAGSHEEPRTAGSDDRGATGSNGGPTATEGATDDAATVLLIRHGETPWNRDRRIQGWAPVGLNDRGRAEARAAGEWLREAHAVDRIVASDLDRTRETARILRRGLPLSVEAVAFESGWRERDFGVYQGLGYDEVYEDRPEFAVHHTGVASFRAVPEGGESTLDLRERVLSAWERLLAELSAGETVLVVTHGGPIHVVLADVAGHDLATELTDYANDNCGVSEVRVASDPTLVRRNATGPPG